MGKTETTTSIKNNEFFLDIPNISQVIEKSVLGIILCPDCFGDGIETCHNPDHGFLSAVIGANESACRCCGHSSDHKMKGKCDTCKGTGQVTKEQYDTYLDEYVDENCKDAVDDYCLKNYLQKK